MQQILLKKKKKKRTKKISLKTIEEKIAESSDPRKTKMTIEFNNVEMASVKSFAVKKKKCDKRYMSGKLLMFAKLSLKSFIYSLIELFSFLIDKFKKFLTNIRQTEYFAFTI